MPKNKSFIHLFWSFADNTSQQILNFIVGIILASLLLPEEFGLVGIITVFIALSNVFVDGGFSAALINKRRVSQIDYNTVFLTNIGISVLLYTILFLSSEWIAFQFNLVELKNLLRLAGLNIILISLELIHRTIFIKHLNFRIITIISFISVSVSAGCAIIMAYRGYGVYSLIYRILIGEVIAVVLFWAFNKWRPSLSFSLKSLKEMSKYGINLLLSNLLNSLQLNIYYILIGKFYNASQLGYYTRATIFRDLLSTNVSSIVKKVSFSTLSKINDKKIQLEKFLFFRRVAFLTTCLACLTLLLCSKEVILIILSEKWLLSADILSIISISGVFIVLYNLTLDYIAVLGKTKLYLDIELATKILIIPIILIGVFYDFYFFIYSIVVHNLIILVIVGIELNRLISGTLKSLLSLMSRYLLMIAPILTINILDKNIIILNNIYLSFIIKFLVAVLVFLLFNITDVKKTIKFKNHV